jgi:alkanesulfonate monooxygenase SsuD/methylene tetrahydromethanopterin reductase-like flavin-dependent oxidoreductase (luciferase family)
LRVEAQKPRKQHRGDVGHPHRHAGVARFRPFDRVHGERAQRVGEAAQVRILGLGKGRGQAHRVTLITNRFIPPLISGGTESAAPAKNAPLAASEELRHCPAPRSSAASGLASGEFRDGEAGRGHPFMRLSVVTFMRPGAEAPRQTLERIAGYARRIEASGFPGIWVTDSLGRGRPTLDPLVALGALAAVTKRVELGTAVLQVSLRNPVELAHRVQSVQALSGGRLRLGVGSGSTKADFDLLGADFRQRFRNLMSGLDIMRRAWRGEPVNGGTLTPWPGAEGGPPVLLGAWRNPRWIAYAAKQCRGWIASGLYSSWEDLESGMRLYREAGGANAVLANVVVDLADQQEPGSLAERAKVSLVCRPEEARRRLKRIEQIGFDEVLVVSLTNALDEIERLRDYL